MTTGLDRSTPAGCVTTITVGRGTARNALRDGDWLDLAETARALTADTEVRAVVLRGCGNHFSAGSDLGYWRGAAGPVVAASFAAMEAALQAVESIPVPVIAAVTGVAAGAGCQLALACDLRIVTPDARIGMPIAGLGIMPSASFADRLVRVSGSSVAREVLFTGRLLDGAGALARGLADVLVPNDELDRTIAAWTEEIVAAPRSTLVAAKQAIRLALRTATDSARAEGPTTVDPDVFGLAMEAFAHRHR